MGCDILYYSYTPFTLIGIQRKEINDFIASINDGRLEKELGQIEEAPLSHAILILEGPIQYTNDGNLTSGTFTKASLRNVLTSIQSRSIISIVTDDIMDTQRTIITTCEYLVKPNHTTLLRRPKTSRNSWGNTNSESFASHLLQSFPNIGYTTAIAIYKHFGHIPLQWECDVAELVSIPGIGKKTAEQLIAALKA